MPPFYADPNLRPSLEPDKYSLQQDESDFFKALTGIHDDDELREHILAVQAKAYKIYGYPCIRRFLFLRLKIARLSGYTKALSLLQTRTHPILLDIGCCFGNDTRKAVVDGWPVHDVIASDLRQGFWDCGHELFNSTPATFPAAFTPGDIFDPSFLDISLSPPTGIDTDTDIPPLSSLTSLTPLTHRVSAIHASSFFHLFHEPRQLELAHRLAALLIPQKGSIIFGQHGSRPEKGFRIEAVASSNSNTTNGADKDKDRRRMMFCHSPESWTKLWTEDVFGPDQDVRVSVDARLREVVRWDFENPDENKFWVMDWSVEVL